MRNVSIKVGGFLGAFTGLAVTALTYLGDQFANLPFAAFDVFDWMARALPGSLITFGIDTLVTILQGVNLGPTAVIAKLVEQALAITQFVIAGAVFGILLTALGRRFPGRLRIFGLLGGIVFLVPAVLVEFWLGFPAAGVLLSVAWLALLFLGWGLILARLVQPVTAEQAEAPSTELSRRQFLYLVGAGSFTVMVGALGLSLVSRDRRQGGTGSEDEIKEMLGAGDTSGPAASPPQEALNARFEPVTGTRPELTSNRDFYRIDINTRSPEVDAESWRLQVDGLVYNPLSLSLEDLRNRPSVSQVITLSCISNQVGGDLISTSLWTGVRLKDILEEAGLKRGVQEIAVQAADGFYESVPLEEAMDERTLLVYAMNGEPLPIDHGFPLRIYIPDHYGMKQPKWITRMEAIDHEGAGYWVERGWSKRAFVRATSVIDTVASDEIDPETGEVPVGGIAYAGARGVSKVEVQVDDGAWEPAELREPPLSPLTWVQWRYLWRSTPGRHIFRVRAYDGDGMLQESEPAPPHPDGATGIYTMAANIRR